MKSRNMNMVFWSLCTVGFLFLSADDGFRFHERLDFWFHDLTGIKETPLTDRLDDLIVLIYGIAGGCIFWTFYRNYWENKKIKIWISISIIFFLIMVVLDFVSNDNYLYQFVTPHRALDNKIGMILGTIEDTAKDLAETTLIISFLECFQSLLKGNIEQENLK